MAGIDFPVLVLRGGNSNAAVRRANALISAHVEHGATITVEARDRHDNPASCTALLVTVDGQAAALKPDGASCGQLVLDLRKRLRAMPGGVLKVIALDIGAPEDLPAWCRLTRNELVAHDHDTRSFWIRSRTDWG